MEGARMNAAQAINAAWAAGVKVQIDGVDLVLQAEAAPPAAVIDALAQHKSEVLALLRPGEDGWSAEDWHSFFHRWTRIAKNIGGLSGSEAKSSAFMCCITEWLNRHPARQGTGRCLLCGEGDRLGDPLLPFGTADGGRGWLHFGCWPVWRAHWPTEAGPPLRRSGSDEPGESDER